MGKKSKKVPDKEEPKMETCFRRIPNQMRSRVNPVVQKLLSTCTDAGTNTKKDLASYKDVFEKLQEVRIMEKDYAPPVIKREDHWDDFCKWCSENGAEFGAVSIKKLGEGDYGMVAEKDLKEAEHFLTVPRKLMMSLEKAMESKLGPLMNEDPILTHMPNVALSLFLAMEALNKNSFWSPYISILPSSYDTVLYYSLEELQLLQRSPVIEKAVKTCQSVARQYAYFHQMFQRNTYAKSLDIGHYFTYDLYRWAVSTVMTRQNAVPTEDGSSETTVLIPVWDMCNHMNGKFSTDFSLSKDCLESFVMKNFDKGEEVCIFYGPRSNAEFFIHNAFIYPPNENDWLDLKLNVSKSDPLALQKTALCEAKNITSNGVFRLQKKGVVGGDLLMFLKIYVMKEDEVEEASKDESLFDETSDKGKELGNRALKFLRDRCSLLLRSYGTTVEEDEAFLQNAENVRSKNAVLLRILEKKILNDCVSYCEDAMK